MLLILGGLPGTGKTTIARALARRLSAVHLRIDSIEQAMRDQGVVTGDMGPAGYVVGYAIARDNLVVGGTVIADSVNPIEITRAAWRSVAEEAGMKCVEIELWCSDVDEHRRRIETRVADLPGLRLPTWAQVEARQYDPWPSATIRLDTATLAIDECTDRVASALR